MAKAEKRISINAYEKAMKEYFPATDVVEWAGLEVTVKRHISAQEMLAFVNNVVESGFDSERNYVPEALDFAIRLNVLTRYANFTMPQDVVKQYDFVYGTDAVEVVMEHINMNQLNEITGAIKRKIQYARDINVSVVHRELMKLVNSFDELQTSTEKIFEGVSSDDLNKLVGALAAHGELDEKKIVDALLENGASGVAQEAAADGV